MQIDERVVMQMGYVQQTIYTCAFSHLARVVNARLFVCLFHRAESAHDRTIEEKRKEERKKRDLQDPDASAGRPGGNGLDGAEMRLNG